MHERNFDVIPASFKKELYFVPVNPEGVGDPVLHCRTLSRSVGRFMELSQASARIAATMSEQQVVEFWFGTGAT